MKIFFVRHGDAENREVFAKRGLSDSLRPLTEKGRKRIQKLAVKLRTEMSETDLIISSPLTRTRQTAEIFSQIYFDIPVVESPELAPGNPEKAFLKWMKSHLKNEKSIIVVGHEPQLSNFVSWLLSGHEKVLIEFKKGSVACLEVEKAFKPGDSKLLWHLHPKIIL